MPKGNKKEAKLVDFVEQNKAQTKALKKLLISIEAQKDKINKKSK